MAHLKKYRCKLEDLLASLDDFEAADIVSYEDLSRLVGHIALVTKTVPIERLLEGLTNQDMSPTSRDRLLDCLSKITRYRECARFLCVKAEKLPMLRNVIVQQVQHAAQAGGIFIPSLTTVGLEQSLRRFQYGGNPVQISTLPGWLAEAVMSFPQSFSKDVNKILREAKVHAEVQLLAHYDKVSHGVVPPRILASSKDACYLCHSLIKLHGKYAVPKSHGRLYKGWCLPAAYQEGPLQRSLNSFLERQILATLQNLMVLNRRPLKMFSNESTIFPISLSESAWAGPPSSLISSASRREVVALAQSSEADATRRMAGQETTGLTPERIRHPHVREMGFYSVDNDVSTPRVIPVDASDDESGGESNHDVGDDGVDQASDNDAESDGTHHTMDGSLASDVVETMLEPGQTITYEPAPGSRFWFRTNRMDVFIDDSSARFSLTWLSEHKAEAVLRTDTDAVLDAESVSAVVDVTLTKDAEGHRYFATGGEVVMIRALDRVEDLSS
ncbi:hypothetical protein VMCG_00896 [Cytospora schulzeri]|uniref:Uncharacterized protein n=1 Tax=Cytospora schulzeri TaxID=448051 RepID=A0A423X5B3_9PEZI|nr:hypothetical protein VMCG_00896 [Valsa malicola]